MKSEKINIEKGVLKLIDFNADLMHWYVNSYFIICKKGIYEVFWIYTQMVL
jgi:hypothetical protein